MSWAALKELCSKHDFEWLGEVCRLAEYTKTALHIHTNHWTGLENTATERRGGFSILVQAFFDHYLLGMDSRFFPNRPIFSVIYSTASLAYLSTSFWMSYSVYCVVFSGMQGVRYFGFWEMGKAFDTTYTLYHSL